MTCRILYGVDSLKVGGAEMLLLDHLDRAAERGLAAHVAYFTPGPLERELAARGVGSTRLSSAGLRDPRALARATALMRRWRPSVFHSHLTKSDLVGQLAAAITAVPRRIVTLHNAEPWRRSRALSSLYRTATSRAHGFIAVSQEVADYVAGTGGVTARRVRVIPNGVDLQRFNPNAIAPMDLSSFGVPSGAVTASIIGRLTAQKDHETFLCAAARLAAREPRVHFLVTGDGPLRAALKARAAELGLSDRLTFTGIVHDVPGLLAAVDIVVLSSRWEGLPMTMLEAMAMQRPVVATRVGGIPSVIEHERSGILVDAENPAALADGIGRLVANEKERRSFGRAAAAVVAQRHDGRSMMDQVFRVYGLSCDDLLEPLNSEAV